ncbi:uncharacterized protein F4812DRAFT_8723 [Daldinia caldariorum]|uniref:uncharacterized protein n=1 Tax=Daldinia caldariorum TaxID=326644 RepID=UPI0020085FE5|nr:uncharacterized protein F4812DRAFT_8723 [Daldinia caldariorum]KAI1472318.1 hypothetical protein F4812DRAFT_8723 [Daldinia caldariorum]
MMSFLNLIISGLLRAIPLQVIGSTGDRVPDASSGSSGAEFFVAELELQSFSSSTSCPANPQSPIITNHPVPSHTPSPTQLPEPPEPALPYAGRRITSPSLSVLHPIDSVSSFASGSNITGSGSASDSRTTNSSRGRKRGKPGRPNRNDTVGQNTAKQQRESDLCWRGYWG